MNLKAWVGEWFTLCWWVCARVCLYMWVFVVLLTTCNSGFAVAVIYPPTQDLYLLVFFVHIRLYHFISIEWYGNDDKEKEPKNVCMSERMSEHTHASRSNLNRGSMHIHLHTIHFITFILLYINVVHKLMLAWVCGRWQIQAF